MSYPRDLDEIPHTELIDELFRRNKLAEEQKCDYCKRKYNEEPACKFPRRHSGEERCFPDAVTT